MAQFTVYASDALTQGTEFADTFVILPFGFNDAETIVFGGGGNDTYALYIEPFSPPMDLVLVEEAGGGTDTVALYDSVTGWDVTLAANIENLVVAGSAYSTPNLLTGNALGNRISVSAGSTYDTLDGGAGADTLAGGTGSDIYYVDSAGDVIVEAAAEGLDHVYGTLASGTFVLGPNVEDFYFVEAGTAGNVNVTGNAESNTIHGNAGNNVLSGLGGDDSLNGGPAGDDTLLGGDGNDFLAGGPGRDRIDGGAGNDQLDGGADNDTLQGGAGDDIFIVRPDEGTDTITDTAGNDTVLADISYTLPAGIENLELGAEVEGLDGTGNAGHNRIVGTVYANRLAGLDGNDTLDGGAGNDTMLGGKGNDVYRVGSSGDVVTEGASEGIDTVLAEVASYSLPVNVENLTIATANLLQQPVGRGNALANLIRGSTQANALYGFDGNDTLIGVSSTTGNPLEGPDTLAGGADNDTYEIGNALDLVIEQSGQGTDTVRSSATYALPFNVEHLELTGTDDIDATGNGEANRLTGNAGDNVLDGAGGADTLAGGTGNDTYYVDSAGDTVIEAANAGTDTVHTATNLTLGANLENAAAIPGSGGLTLVGNALGNVLTGASGADTLNGGLGNDSLSGGHRDDSLAGGDGADTLDGGRGNDTMAGGPGNDVYYVSSSGDIVSEVAGAGIDTVTSEVSVTAIWANVENVILGPAARNVNGGNSLDNRITGNALRNLLDGEAGNDSISGGAGNDTLDGGTGNDFLFGGDGNDIYYIDSDDDEIAETGGSADQAFSVVSFLGDTAIEHVTLLDAGGAIDALGNDSANRLTGNASGNSLQSGAGNDTLFGNAGDDTLDGGTGNDSMKGGAGNDIYVVSGTADHVDETGGDGIDTVHASVTFSLANTSFVHGAVENLTLTGTGNISATGNALDNLLTGNSADNTLTGAAGDDTLIGGAGSDSMVGGAGNDTYDVDSLGDTVSEGLNAGTDTVLVGNLTFDYTLPDNHLENLTINSSEGPVRATGNAGANLIRLPGVNTVGATIEGGEGNDTVDARGAAVVDDSGIEFYGGVETRDGGGADEIFLELSGSYSNLVVSGFETVNLDVEAGATDLGASAIAGAKLIVLSGDDPLTFNAAGGFLAGKTFRLTDYFDSLAFSGADGTLVLELDNADFSLSGASITALDITTLDTDCTLDVSGLTDATLYTIRGDDDVTLSGLADGADIELFEYAGASFHFDAEPENGTFTLFLGNTFTTLTAGSNVTEVTLDVTGTAPSGVTVEAQGTLGLLALSGADDPLQVTNLDAAVVDATNFGIGTLLLSDRVAGSIFIADEGTADDSATIFWSGFAGGQTLEFGADAGGITGTFAVLDSSDRIVDGATGDGDALFANASGINGVFGALAISRIEDVTFYASSGTVEIDASRMTEVEWIYINAGGSADSFTLIDVSSHVDGTASTSPLTILFADAYAGAVATGGSGDDSLAGTDGEDQLNGADGNDTLAGGGDADSFAFDTAPGAGNVDTILDFASGTDKLALDSGVFAGLTFTGGVLDATSFSDSGAPASASPQIVYDPSTGALYYDADGNTSGATQPFAQLGDGVGGDYGIPLIAATDIYELIV